MFKQKRSSQADAHASSDPSDKGLEQPRVALVHDWLVSQGGAEREVLEICRTFPDAPLYTSVYFPDKTLPAFESLDVRPSWIQKVPILGQRHRLAVPLRYIHWRFILPRKLKDFDIIVSSSGSEAKIIKTRPSQLHINICFSPTHYYWSHFDEYLENPGLGWLNPIAKVLLKIGIWPLRQLDLYAARQPDKMIAISTAVQQRIKRYYNRESTVIFPPVSDLGLKPSDIKGERSGLVVVGRQVPYKRIDLAIAAANQLKAPLEVIGSGPESKNLRAIAGETIRFLGETSENDKIEALTQAQALIFPNQDDFGITPVEAMMAGCPVVAYRAGGALDTVASDSAGVYFDQQNPDSIAQATQALLDSPPDPAATRTWAMKFHSDNFRQRLEDYVNNQWGEFNND